MKPGQSGFVLLIVLWTLVILALLGTQLGVGARAEWRVAEDTRAAALLESAADGGIGAAIFHILGRAWAADSLPRESRFGAIRLTTTIANEAGRINPNTSAYPLMVALLHVVSHDQRRAGELANAMLLWRTRPEAILAQYRGAGLPYGPSGAAFQSVEELGLVLGMTPELLRALRPHLSLFQQGDVDRRFADSVVRQALDEAGPAAAPLAALNVRLDDLLARITVLARGAGGRSFVRAAEVRFAAHPDAGAPLYTILSWENEYMGENE
jgi:general secretion pathway protein K